VNTRRRIAELEAENKQLRRLLNQLAPGSHKSDPAWKTVDRLIVWLQELDDLCDPLTARSLESSVGGLQPDPTGELATTRKRNYRREASRVLGKVQHVVDQSRDWVYETGR
jgi:hypothetical protein